MTVTKEPALNSLIKAQAELEQALLHLESMPAVDPDLISFTAHTLNNYLTVSGGVIDLLLLQFHDSCYPQHKSWLESLRHATDLMTANVSKLMNLSANQDGFDTKLRPENVDLTLLVRRLCNYYERIASKKKIGTDFISDPAIQNAWADRVALAAIIDNLLSNAVKYSPVGKKINVEVSDADNFLAVSVEDQGPGLSEDEQSKLFQKGIKLKPRPTGGESSSGYGLAVAKDLVQKLSGQIHCESQLGSGYKFSIKIPKAEESD